MLVFAGIAPHPPMLVPAIGKKLEEQLRETQNALIRLEQDLYSTQPSVMIVLSPHGTLFDQAFTVNAHTHFGSAFEQFGDLETKAEWTGATVFASRIGREARLAPAQPVDVRLTSQEKIDHGVSVPLIALTRHLPHIRILPIGFSNASPEEHLRFGGIIREVALHAQERIAILASADLSHRLSDASPAGFDANGARFDSAILTLLSEKKFEDIATLDPELVAQAGECGYRAILMLLGALNGTPASFETFAYEAPFGVGYLTGRFSW